MSFYECTKVKMSVYEYTRVTNVEGWTCTSSHKCTRVDMRVCDCTWVKYNYTWVYKVDKRLRECTCVHKDEYECTRVSMSAQGWTWVYMGECVHMYRHVCTYIHVLLCMARSKEKAGIQIWCISESKLYTSKICSWSKPATHATVNIDTL